MSVPSSLWDIEEVAEQLRVTERFVRRLVAERRIPYVKVGRFVRFDPADIADWISAARVPTRSVSQPFPIIDFEPSTPSPRARGSVSRR